MLSRRRFIEITTATTVAGAALGVTQDAVAAGASGTIWASPTWQGLQGQPLTIVDASGASQTVRVGAVAVLPKQARTRGEAFMVALVSEASRHIPDGLYRLRGGVRGQVFLNSGKPGAATLTINSVRPTA